MEIFTGTDRIVITGDKRVAKFPRVKKSDILIPVKDTLHYFREYGWAAVRQMWSLDSDMEGTFRQHLLHGLRANQREARIAKTYPYVVLATRSFLGGIVNVQAKTEHPSARSVRDRAGIFYTQLGGRDTPRLGHMIEDEHNFGYDFERRLTFVDGGSHGLETLLNEGRYSKIVTALANLTELYAQPST